MDQDKIIRLSKPAYDFRTEREANAIGKKIAAARKMHGYKLDYMVEALHNFGIDITKKAISKWEYGESVPSAYQLVALSIILDLRDFCELINEYTPALNEEGLKKVDSYREDLIASGRYAYTPVAKPVGITRIDTVKVLFSLLPVSAGVGEYLTDENMEKRDIPRHLIPYGADFAVPVSGDSMEPDFHDGEYVWVQRTANIPEDSIGIFEYDGSGYIKKYTEQAPADDMVDAFTDADGAIHTQPVLISLNPLYAPIVIRPYADFRPIGIVLGKVDCEK